MQKLRVVRAQGPSQSGLMGATLMGDSHSRVPYQVGQNFTRLALWENVIQSMGITND